MCFLLLHYRGSTVPGLLLLPLYGAVVLLLGAYGSTWLTSTLRSSSLLALIVSKEKGTFLAHLAHILSACLSSVLLAQVLWHRGRTAPRSKGKSE
ncbi:hypothetical protein CRUP_011430 [Coryphaenoides rupestris]|nr:hypothetical protein CRUP_011430 [Coryphaenoides rupestris]